MGEIPLENSSRRNAVDDFNFGISLASRKIRPAISLGETQNMHKK